MIGKVLHLLYVQNNAVVEHADMPYNSTLGA